MELGPYYLSAGQSLVTSYLNVLAFSEFYVGLQGMAVCSEQGRGVVGPQHPLFFHPSLGSL